MFNKSYSLSLSLSLHPGNSSVNSSFDLRGPATANAFLEYVFIP